MDGENISIEHIYKALSNHWELTQRLLYWILWNNDLIIGITAILTATIITTVNISEYQKVHPVSDAYEFTELWGAQLKVVINSISSERKILWIFLRLYNLRLWKKHTLKSRLTWWRRIIFLKSYWILCEFIWYCHCLYLNYSQNRP